MYTTKREKKNQLNSFSFRLAFYHFSFKILTKNLIKIDSSKKFIYNFFRQFI